MSAGKGVSAARFDELKPGDRIAIRQTVTDGDRPQTVTTTGTVVRTEHARHESPGEGAMADGPLRDRILLELPDGEFTTVTIDELTELNRA